MSSSSIQKPLGPPPPGGSSNFIDPPRNNWATEASIYGSLPLVFIFLVLRVYARLRITRKFDLDDYLFLIGCAFSFTFCGVMIHHMYMEIFGYHYWDIPASKLTPEYQQIALTALTLYLATAMFIKLSLLSLYYRIFRPSKYTTILVWVGVALVILPYLAIIITYLVVMCPRAGEGGWLGRQTLVRVARYTRPTSLAQGIIGTVTDLYILTIPLGMIYNLHLSTSRKVGIASIFLMGSAACAFSIMGIYFRVRATQRNPNDPIWFATYTFALAVAELNIGLVCNCIPVIFVLFKYPAEKLKAAWGSVKSYVSSHTKSSRLAPSEDTLVTSEPSVLSGGSKATGALGTKTSEYYELQSVDCDYHAYVQGGPGPKKDGKGKKS